MKNKSKPEKGFGSECIICSRKRTLEIRHRNIELTRERDLIQYYKRRDTEIPRMRKASEKQRKEGKQKQWQIDNPKRVSELAQKHRNHDISTQEWNNELKVFDFKCAYCDISQEDAKKRDKQQLHKDHVDHQGYNDLRNSAPACRSCNDKKWQHDMETWFREQPFFTEEKLQKILWWCNEGYKDYIEDKPPYKVVRKRIYDEGGGYTMGFELWSVNERRDLIECIKTGNKLKDVKL